MFTHHQGVLFETIGIGARLTTLAQLEQFQSGDPAYEKLCDELQGAVESWLYPEPDDPEPKAGSGDDPAEPEPNSPTEDPLPKAA